MAEKERTSKDELKGLKAYVTEINSALREHLGLKKGAQIPFQYHVLIQKTAMDMRTLDRIAYEIEDEDWLIDKDAIGVAGQNKPLVCPLIPYYEKMSARVTDDFYNLGLTARKQAAKTDDQRVDDNDPMKQYYQTK